MTYFRLCFVTLFLFFTQLSFACGPEDNKSDENTTNFSRDIVLCGPQEDNKTEE